ncbi:MAG: hypothetical protein ACYC8V_13955, partial [Caulobacteraceae bacterium]
MSDTPFSDATRPPPRPSAPAPKPRPARRTVVGIAVVILVAVLLGLLLSRCAANKGRAGPGGPGAG